MNNTAATKPARFICSCGCAEHHETWKRTTADGKIVMGWSDGLITFALGIGIKGVSASRSASACAADIRAGWIVAGDVCLFDATDMPGVIARARKAARRSGTTFETIRAAIHGDDGRTPRPPGAWTVLSTDRDGKPTERVWRFPKLSPLRDCAIWHERGRFEICTRMLSAPNGMLRRSDGDTFEPNGSRHTSLRDAIAECFVIVGLA